MSTDLRKQFNNYMTLQRLSPHTKRNYIRAVKGLAEYYNQSPDLLTNDQIQEYLRHLLEDRKLSWGTCNNYFSGIITFYRNVCKWDETRFQIPRDLQQGRSKTFIRFSKQLQTSGLTEDRI